MTTGAPSAVLTGDPSPGTATPASAGTLALTGASAPAAVLDLAATPAPAGTLTLTATPAPVTGTRAGTADAAGAAGTQAGTAADAQEALLLAEAGTGDESAFRALWDTVQRQAFGVCLHLTGNRADALDALQETQLATWRGLPAFEGRASFRSWVLVIARNAAYTVVRRRSPAGVIFAEVDETSAVAEPFEDSVARLADLRRALAALPPSQREVLLLWAGGLTYEQVAVSLGVPLNTVRVWIHRGRRRLRAGLAEN